MTALVAEDRILPDDLSDVRQTAELDAARDSVCDDALFSFAGHVGGIAVAADGSLLVSDLSSGTIWRVDQDGATSPLIVKSSEASNAWDRPLRLFTPAGLALGADGTLIVADSSRHRICTLSSDGTLSVLAGGSNGYHDGPVGEAMFRYPSDVAVAPDGTCYVADTANDRIRAISPGGVVRTVAGSNYDYGDGHGNLARFRRPAAIDLDRGGILYVADTGNNAVRRVTPDGEVTTVTGLPPGGDGDGRGACVGLRWPTGIAADADGSLWVADHGNAAVRHLGIDGVSTTELRLAGVRRPTVVSKGQDASVFVAAEVWADGRLPQACVMVLGGRR